MQELRGASDPELPRRLDSSVWARWGFSGSNQSALKGALVFLGLTTEEYEPTRRLTELLRAYRSDEERRMVLHGLVSEYYLPLLGGIDLARTTRLEIRDAFRRAGSGQQTSDKAVTFFVALAQESGRFELSGQLAKARTHRRRNRQPGAEKQVSEKPSMAVSEKLTENDPASPQIAQPFATAKVIHPMLRALVDELPAQGEQWPVGKKQMFERVWAATLTYLYGGPDGNEMVT